MKKRAIAMVLLATCCLVSPGWTEDDIAGLPQDAAAIVTRLSVCSHFANEEASNKARAREIAGAMRQYRCDTIARDEAAMRNRYANDPNVIKALAAAAQD
jgi:hypothetical protein